MTREAIVRDKKSFPIIFTIGHSTRPVTEFIEIIRAYGIEKVADIRTVPKSRHNPQFNREALKESLETAGVGYSHMQGLGGLRHPQKVSVNTAWRNESFRGFADYMHTKEFEENLEKLIAEANERVTVVMCAEAVPWRCHRSLIGDALTVRGLHVRHIISAGSGKDHTLTPWAKVEGSRITYPGDDSQSTGV